jgi:hypothetical protein
MTDRSRLAQVENEIREKMSIVVGCLRPYAQSRGSFVDWNDLRQAITPTLSSARPSWPITSRRRRRSDLC